MSFKVFNFFENGGCLCVCGCIIYNFTTPRTNFINISNK